MRISTSMLVLAAMAVVAAGPSGAQYVSLDGSYGEANGQIVDIPNNQPQQFIGACSVGQARCRGYKKVLPTQMTSAIPLTFKRPVNGVPRRKALQTIEGGLAVGAQFKIPASFFGQSAPDPGLPGIGAGPVLQNAVNWISTAYYARMPAAQRGSRLNHPNPPGVNPQTRVMRAQPAGPITGQAGRDLEPTNITPLGRKQIQHVMDNVGSNDTGVLTYTEGPNRFGGVMTALLDGYSDLNVRAFGAFDVYFPAGLRPVVAIQRAGDYDATAMGNNPHLSFMTRNGAGWAQPILGGQAKAPIFGPVATVAGEPCEPATLPATPVGCQRPVILPMAQLALSAMGGILPNAGYNLLDNGNFLRTATSVKYAFPFTTGTVTMKLDVQRGNGQTYLETLTGMGYDTVTAMGARNVGLVAGSYTNRASGGSSNLNFQLLGVDLQLRPVPEVASASALVAGVTMLGLAATRRRR